MIFGIATKKGGQCAAFPDVCKTPAPPSPSPVPIPYPNVAMLNQLSNGTKKVKIENQALATKKSKIPMSSGDEPGVAGGVISSKFKGPAKPKTASSKVKAEGQKVIYQTCLWGQNGNNANMPAGVCAMTANTKVKVSM